MEKPPLTWEKDFKCDSFKDAEWGYKNKNDLFFFSDSKLSANCYGVERANKFLEKTGSSVGYYLTKIEPPIELNVIDFSNCITIHNMISLLHSLGIDVMNEDFITCSKGSSGLTFGEFREIFELMNSEKDPVRLGELDQELIAIIGVPPKTAVPDEYRVPAFGQRLTDFDNARHFKSLVQTKFIGIDGYKWREGIEGYTYGLFDASKLPSNGIVVDFVDAAARERNHQACMQKMMGINV